MIEQIEWIACSERLPTAQETVLFCAVDSDGGDRYILQGWHEGGEWYGVDDPKPFPSALYWAAWPAGPRPDLLTISETAERLRVSARTVTDAQQALAQVREALRNEALYDPDAAIYDTVDAGLALNRACNQNNMSAILAHVEAQAAEIKRLRKLAMSTHLFEEAPCFLCGYNGPGYYQPEQHPCAALYHEAMEES